MANQKIRETWNQLVQKVQDDLAANISAVIISTLALLAGTLTWILSAPGALVSLSLKANIPWQTIAGSYTAIFAAGVAVGTAFTYLFMRSSGSALSTSRSTRAKPGESYVPAFMFVATNSYCRFGPNRRPAVWHGALTVRNLRPEPLTRITGLRAFYDSANPNLPTIKALDGTGSIENIEPTPDGTSYTYEFVIPRNEAPGLNEEYTIRYEIMLGRGAGAAPNYYFLVPKRYRPIEETVIKLEFSDIDLPYRREVNKVIWPSGNVGKNGSGSRIVEAIPLERAPDSNGYIMTVEFTQAEVMRHGWVPYGLQWQWESPKR